MFILIEKERKNILRGDFQALICCLLHETRVVTVMKRTDGRTDGRSTEVRPTQFSRLDGYHIFLRMEAPLQHNHVNLPILIF